MSQQTAKEECTNEYGGEYNEWTYTNPGGLKGTWLCHLCQYNKATKKITYTGGTLSPGFKLSCDECITTDYGRDFFSFGCKVIIHNKKIEN